MLTNAQVNLPYLMVANRRFVVLNILDQKYRGMQMLIEWETANGVIYCPRKRARVGKWLVPYMCTLLYQLRNRVFFAYLPFRVLSILLQFYFPYFFFYKFRFCCECKRGELTCNFFYSWNNPLGHLINLDNRVMHNVLSWGPIMDCANYGARLFLCEVRLDDRWSCGTR